MHDLFVNEFVTFHAQTAHVATHARLVRDKSLLRSLINVGSEISTSAFEQDDIAEIIGQAHHCLLEVAHKQATSSLITMPDLMHRVLNQIDAAQAHTMAGVPSGFPDLDELTGGFQRGNLILLAARPAMGKTSLGLQVAAYAAQYLGQPVLVFSLEMSADELGQRLLCSEARVDSKDIRRGNMSSGDWGPLMHASERLRALPMLIDDSSSLTPLDVRSRATRVRMEQGLGMIVVDYLQEVEKRGSRPQLSDLRDSGGLEQNADVVLFIHREMPEGEEHSTSQETESHDHPVELLIAKQRNGPTGMVQLLFRRQYTRFENMAHAHHHHAVA